jgi:hypothetical protein
VKGKKKAGLAKSTNCKSNNEQKAFLILENWVQAKQSTQ